MFYKKNKHYDLDDYDITDKIVIADEKDIFKINYKYPIELDFERMKTKFGIRLIKYLNDIKNNEEYYNIIFDNYFILWKKIAIENNSMSLFILINYLTKREAYNIKKTIFSLVTNDNLKDPFYYKFISEFINL